MPDNKKEPLIETLPSNSHVKKVRKIDSEVPERRKVEKIVTGTVKKQKKGLGKRIAETFLEDDSRGVGNYVVTEVLIPAIKDMIYNSFMGGLEISLFGNKRGSRGTNRNRSNPYTSYDKVSYNSPRDRGGPARDISRSTRAKHDFFDIVIEHRGEAEEILSLLVDFTVDYGVATVSDLYDSVGITSEFTDDKYGWYDLREANVARARGGGYVLNLPKPQPLD